jgi:integrase
VDESTRVRDRKVAETIRAKREWELLQETIHGRRSVASFLEATVAYVDGGGERRYLPALIEYFGATPLAEIAQGAIDCAAAELYPNAGPATRNRQVYTPISAVLKHAAKRGLCEFRPIQRPKQPRGRIRWVTPGDAEVLITECAPHLRPLIIFLLYTGARTSEALYLDWSNVDIKRAHVTFVDTKNGESRGVPLHSRVLAELAAMPHRRGPVFLRPDNKPYARKMEGGGQFKTAFKGACRRAGIADFSPHDLRHTWATWFYAATRDLVGLMHLGGWKSEKMVLRYTHVNVEHLAPGIQMLPWGNRGKQRKRRPKKQHDTAA